MFSEFTTAIGHGLAAASLLAATTLIVAKPTATAVGNAFSYGAPLFTCESGMSIYKRIINNRSISFKERQDLVRTLMADMPRGCIALQETAKNYREI